VAEKAMLENLSLSGPTSVATPVAGLIFARRRADPNLKIAKSSLVSGCVSKPKTASTVPNAEVILSAAGSTLVAWMNPAGTINAAAAIRRIRHLPRNDRQCLIKIPLARIIILVTLGSLAIVATCTDRFIDYWAYL
jgi:hypothetical protein